MVTENALPKTMTTGMLLRVPASKAFEAFVDPAVTTKFWFTDSDGKLAANANVNWTWKMYGLTIPVRVLEIVPNERIKIHWGDENRNNDVEWTFESRAEGHTFVKIVNDRFSGSESEVAAQVVDSMGGFSLVLAGAKAFLEHGVELNLTADRTG